MKKLLILFSIFAIVSLARPSEAQRVRQLADISADAAATDYSGIITMSGGYGTLSVDILCTEVGGTADGNIQLQSRNGSGGTWTYIGEFFSGDFLEINDADSIMTITDGAVFRVVLTPSPFYQYRFAVTGTANDTTTVTFDYLINY